MIGWIGSALLSLCALPEVYKTILNKRCDIGWYMLLMWFFGEIAMLIHTVQYEDNPLLVNYLINIGLISVLMYYKTSD